MGTGGPSTLSQGSAPGYLSYGYTGSVGDQAFGATNSSPNPMPTVSSQAILSSPSINGGSPGVSAVSSIGYYMYIVGTPGSVSVNVTANGSASLSAGSPGLVGEWATAGFNVYQTYSANGQVVNGGSVVSDGVNISPGAGVSSNVSGSYSTGYSGAFNENGTYSFQTNALYFVSLEADVYGLLSGNVAADRGYSGDLSFNGYASVDPTFNVPQGYSILLSEGIGNGVPEPSTWAMMLIGFGGLGLAGYRRTKQAVAS